jgi:hypothetical protein
MLCSNIVLEDQESYTKEKLFKIQSRKPFWYFYSIIILLYDYRFEGEKAFIFSAAYLKQKGQV